MSRALPGSPKAWPLSRLLHGPSQAAPPVFRLVIASSFFVVATYVAFQKKLLPPAVSKLVAKLYFWPTLPITVGMRHGNLWTDIDATLSVGVAPTFLSVTPSQLRERGVRGVINLCDEFKGDSSAYKKHGMEELWLPTLDHFEPGLGDVKEAIVFIEKHKKRGQKVYVHCKVSPGLYIAVGTLQMTPHPRY
jgi:atypical dual specificity phosphatase